MIDETIQARRDDESTNERAVSPVIGVILMVAITVILAAVIAAFVLDLGPGDPDPTAAVDVSGGDTTDVEVRLTSLGSDADGIAIVNENGSIIDNSSVDGILRTSGASETFSNTTIDNSTASDEVMGGNEYEVHVFIGELEEGDPIDDADGHAIEAEFTVAA